MVESTVTESSIRHGVASLFGNALKALIHLLLVYHASTIAEGVLSVLEWYLPASNVKYCDLYWLVPQCRFHHISAISIMGNSAGPYGSPLSS